MSDEKPFGPNNPHPLSRMKTELVWEGKYDEFGRRRQVSLPTFPLAMQRIETIDEPRDRSRAQQIGLFDDDAFSRKAHRDDFRNRLIWGDNKLAMAALLGDFRGQVGLIYIDPPFDVGADFTMEVPIGDEGREVDKTQSVLEAVAYRDTWGKGQASYLNFMADRLTVMRDLLAQDGSIFVHCDWHVSHLMRGLLEDIFGSDNFLNEIIWRRKGGAALGQMSRLSVATDTIFWFGRSPAFRINTVYQEAPKEYIETMFRHKDEKGRRFMLNVMRSPNPRPNLMYDYKGYKTPPNGWAVPRDTMERLDAEGRLYFPPSKDKQIYKKIFLDEYPGQQVNNLWTDISTLKGRNAELINYATQKPEELVERILQLGSTGDDLVADFFCGSGTTLAVAEQLGRRWIGADLGRYAIHTTRKRLIGVQRELHAAKQPYRSFDVYNLGRYERQWWQLDRLKGADAEHRATVLKFFRAQPLTSPPSPHLHATKAGAYVHVDSIDSIMTFAELTEVARAASAAGAKSLVCLSWEFEMDLRKRARSLEAELSLTIALKYIPREIMEPNRDELQFFDAGALEAKAIVRVEGKEKLCDVELLNFYPSLTEVPEKELEALRERAVKSPFDFIDFWAVDFEHGDEKPFEHHWQDFRTRKDRKLQTKSDCGWNYDSPGAKRICVKVIDVFGIDTTQVIEVQI